MSILLVDLAAADATVLASALRVEGFDVVIAPTAREARAAMATRSIALAIVDLMLRSEGGSSGLDLAREMRADYPATRVLLTSSYHLSERQLERADCGVSGFIPKPYDLAEVVAFVRRKSSAPPSSRRLWCVETDGPASGMETGHPSGFDLIVPANDVANGTRR